MDSHYINTPNYTDEQLIKLKDEWTKKYQKKLPDHIPDKIIISHKENLFNNIDKKGGEYDNKILKDNAMVKNNLLIRKAGQFFSANKELENIELFRNEEENKKKIDDKGFSSNEEKFLYDSLSSAITDKKHREEIRKLNILKEKLDEHNSQFEKAKDAHSAYINGDQDTNENAIEFKKNNVSPQDIINESVIGYQNILYKPPIGFEYNNPDPNFEKVYKVISNSYEKDFLGTNWLFRPQPKMIRRQIDFIKDEKLINDILDNFHYEITKDRKDLSSYSHKYDQFKNYVDEYFPEFYNKVFGRDEEDKLNLKIKGYTDKKTLLQMVINSSVFKEDYPQLMKDGILRNAINQDPEYYTLQIIENEDLKSFKYLLTDNELKYASRIIGLRKLANNVEYKNKPNNVKESVEKAISGDSTIFSNLFNNLWRSFAELKNLANINQDNLELPLNPNFINAGPAIFTLSQYAGFDEGYIYDKISPLIIDYKLAQPQLSVYQDGQNIEINKIDREKTDLLKKLNFICINKPNNETENDSLNAQSFNNNDDSIVQDIEMESYENKDKIKEWMQGLLNKNDDMDYTSDLFGKNYNINNHKEISNKIGGRIEKIKFNNSKLTYPKFDPIDNLKDAIMMQQVKNPKLHKKKQAKGCGYCGSGNNILVHNKDENDYTCEPCYNINGMSGGRFTSRDANFIKISDSENLNHKKDNKQHEINNYLDKINEKKPLTKFEEFDQSSNIPKDWLRRYEKDFIMNRPFHTKRLLEKDNDRLVFLLGVNEHSPEKMTSHMKANLNSLMIRHLYLNNDPKPEIPNLDALNTFSEIKSQIIRNPGILKKIIVL